MASVVWPEFLSDVLLELPERERSLIIEKTQLLERFPRLYPVRRTGRFRRCRWFLAGNWLVYYRVVEDIVYIRALWPARIPVNLWGSEP